MMVAEYLEDRDPDFAATVYGTPQPAGSKRPGRGSKSGKLFVYDDAKRSRPWKTLVAQEAGRVMAGRELLAGPLELRLRFYVRRPAGHYGKRGVKPSAPAYPAVRPDLLKYARGVEDSLTGLVFRDDAQIVQEVLEKRFGTPERVEIEVYRWR